MKSSLRSRTLGLVLFLLLVSTLFDGACAFPSGQKQEASQENRATEPAPPTSSPLPTSTPTPPAAPESPPPPTTTPTDQATKRPPLPRLKLALTFPNLPRGAFGARPLFLTPVPNGTNLVVVVNQDGKAFLLRNDPSTREVRLFLDLSRKVSREGNEEGLLGLAFHPQYTTNRFFYVYYAALSPRRTVLSRFTVREDTGLADPASETVFLEVPQPFSNHKGGMLAFGPDGFLYIALGDGGGAGDPFGNGQNLNTLLGKILRIDVGHQADGRPYTIPSDNPFVGEAGPSRTLPEIWAYGLRNPWRFSFDRVTGDLWAGDVGQNRMEEIDIIRKGGNYGWNFMEGTLCFRPPTDCNQAGLELPMAEYSLNGACSVIGGYVYRGSRILALQGAYLYSDFCSGRIWALRYDGTSVTAQAQLADTRLNISSFGEDAAGELYVTAFDGNVYRLVAAAGQ